jgi:hypothetical protein
MDSRNIILTYQITNIFSRPGSKAINPRKSEYIIWQISTSMPIYTIYIILKLIVFILYAFKIANFIIR